MNRDRQTHPTNCFDRPGPTLSRLLEGASSHLQTEQLVIEALPDELATNCRFVSFHQGDLTLSVPSSTQASLLRMRQREVLENVRRQEKFRYAWRLNVKVLPEASGNRPTPDKRHLSTENARLLKEEAGHTKDAGLRQVLENLARRVNS